MIRLAALLLSALPAAAQEYPARYDVTGVSADDVLNIRAAPDATAEKLGTLAPDQSGLEVIAENDAGDWGFINFGERSGWVSMHYLARAPGQEDGAFPLITRCLGTEPFWTLSLEGDSAALSRLDQQIIELGGLGRLASSNWRGHFSLVAGGGALTATIRRAACSDQMSDQSFGLAADVVYRGDGGDWQQLTGCCTVRP